MKKFAVLTDSACDIPAPLAQEHHVEVLSFAIMLDGKQYSEREDLPPARFYELLDAAQGMPTTSQITPMTFAQKFADYAAQGVEELLYVAINAGGSATYNNALLAAADFADSHPNSPMRITVLDSHTYSMAYGRFVLRAAEKLAGGAEMCDVVDYLKNRFAHVEVVLSMHSLKIVKRSGRVSAAAAFVGELMGLRPVITIVQGETKVVQKVRGDNKVLPALAEHLQKNAGERTPYMVGATKDINEKHGDARELAKLCEKVMGYPPECIFPLGAAVTSNTGTDAIALVYMRD